MNTENLSQDEKIILKAEKRVKLKISFIFILLILFHCLLISGFYLGYLETDVGNIYSILLLMASSEICLFGFNGILLGFGKKIFRFLYGIVPLFSLVMIGIPALYAFNDLANIVTYVLWILLLLIKTFLLISFGKSLKTNKWCKILFDWVLELEEGQEEEDIEHIYLSDEKPKRIEMEDYEEEEEEPYTLPNLSLRLGICIYVSLVLFPIFTQFFQNFFASSDLQSVFATKDQFILCIFTAMIWTIPLFFYYYNHPKSKLVTFLCIVLELIRLISYGARFMGYIQSNMYPFRVYLAFIFINLLRYAWLIISIKPIFKMEMPEELED